MKREFSRKGQYQMLTKSRRSHILVLKNTFLVLFERITFWLYTETFWHSRNQILYVLWHTLKFHFFIYVDFSRGQRCYLCNRLKLAFFCIMYIYHSIAWHYNFFFTSWIFRSYTVAAEEVVVVFLAKAFSNIISRSLLCFVHLAYICSSERPLNLLYFFSWNQYP